MIGRIRLQWWRETIQASIHGEPARRHEVMLAIDDAFAGESAISEGMLKLVDCWIDRADAPGDDLLECERILADLAGRSLDPGADDPAIERVVMIATSNDRQLQHSLARDVSPLLWPAFPHVAATDSNGQTRTGLAARWRIFWAVARGAL